MIQFPLTLSFKTVAFNPQVRVTNPSGNLVSFVKQKALSFKEDITIYADEDQTRPLFRINADRVIDWSARYAIINEYGEHLGALQREGARSLWKATYVIVDRSGDKVGVVHEENAWVKFADAMLGEIPLAGLFAGYVFNPAYLVDFRGDTMLYLKKQPAFFEGRYRLDQRKQLDSETGPLLYAATILALMMERWRG